MQGSSFGNGLEDDTPLELNPSSQEHLPGATADDSLEADPAPVESVEPRSPMVLGFSDAVVGLPLDLGPAARATLVDLPEGEGLLSLNAAGELKAMRLERGPALSVEAATVVFADRRWAAFDARTCDQTGSVLFVGVDRSSGHVYACVDLESAFSGGEPTISDLGHAVDLGLPADFDRIVAMQLTDWLGRGRLEILAHVKPERDGGGPALFLLERKTDDMTDGYHSAQLADGDADALLGRHPESRLLLVSWTGPGADQLMHSSGDGRLTLLSNFGGMVPPAVGRPRPVVTGKQARPALLPASLASLAWVKPFKNRPGRLVLVDSVGGVSVAEAQTREGLGECRPVLSKAAGELSFGPAAVATATDWDNDGGVDIIVGTAEGGLMLFPDNSATDLPSIGTPVRLESGGDPFRVPARDSRRHRENEVDTGKPRYACPVLCDWTAHQRMDVVVTDSRGAVWYMRNNGGKTQPRLDFADRVSSGGKPLFVSPRSQLAVGHWSGGAEPDIIGFDESGELACWARREKLEVAPATPILDARNRPIRLGGSGARAGLTHLWSGAWTAPDQVELILSMPPAAISRVADWLEAPLDKPLEDFPLFWVLMRNDKGGVITRPLRTADGGLIHRRMAPQARSFSVMGVKLKGRTESDLLVVPDQGQGMIWPRESLRWD